MFIVVDVLEDIVRERDEFTKNWGVHWHEFVIYFLAGRNSCIARKFAEVSIIVSPAIYEDFG